MGGGEGNKGPPGMPSTGLVNYCHSDITHQPPPSPYPILPCSDSPPTTTTAKQRQRQPQQPHPRGPSLRQYLTSATASFCLTRFPPLCYVSLSLSLSLSPSSLLLPYPPSSKHFWLFCFPALQRVIAHDNDHGRLFSLGSPASVCTPG